jgi:hypothetical protein
VSGPPASHDDAAALPTYAAFPEVAAWHHVGARTGHEVVFFVPTGDGMAIDGTTTSTQDGISWWVRFHIELGPEWLTRRAEIAGRSSMGTHRRTLEVDARGRWLVDGASRPDLDGCVDVDLESSACTNTVPIHRLGLGPGQIVDAPAAYVRADDLRVERLEQRYHLGATQHNGLGGHDAWRLGYRAPRFGADLELVIDPHGLVLEYPHLALRAG